MPNSVGLVTSRRFMRKTFGVLVLGLMMAALTMPGFGQATDGNLVGAIMDPTGAAVPNANVELTNQATGVKYTSKTNADGQYRFNNVPAGLYTVTTNTAGFTTTSLKNVPIQLNKTATANLILQVGT